MRLLLINPNISDSVSALIEAEARRSALSGTELTVLTAPFGVAYIETRFEALVGAYAAAQLAAEHGPQHDAVIVAAFGDPGLAGIRELLPVPVLGLTESALASACLLGHRFSIVAISQRIQAWYREEVARCGLLGRLASIRALDRPLARIDGVQEQTLAIGDKHDHIYTGIEGAITLADASGALTLRQQGFTDAVVWNPGAADTAALADMDDTEYLRFVCIEPALIAPVSLKPGAAWRGAHQVTLAP